MCERDGRVWPDLGHLCQIGREKPTARARERERARVTHAHYVTALREVRERIVLRDDRSQPPLSQGSVFHPLRGEKMKILLRFSSVINLI